MKKFLMFILCLLCTLVIYGCSKANIDQILMDAMDSKIEIINDEESILFKDIHIFEEDDVITIDEYAYVDLDKDGNNELVVLVSSLDGSYIILRYDTDSKNVYSYVLGVRELVELNEDGTFTGSGGAFSTSYSRMEFKDNKMVVVDLAYFDEQIKEYVIDNVSVTSQEMDAFVEEWDKKQQVKWTEK